jgi:hypothetical protein
LLMMLSEQTLMMRRLRVVSQAFGAMV